MTCEGKPHQALSIYNIKHSHEMGLRSSNVSKFFVREYKELSNGIMMTMMIIWQTSARNRGVIFHSNFNIREHISQTSRCWVFKSILVICAVFVGTSLSVAKTICNCASSVAVPPLWNPLRVSVRIAGNILPQLLSLSTLIRFHHNSSHLLFLQRVETNIGSRDFSVADHQLIHPVSAENIIKCCRLFNLAYPS